MTVEAIKTLGVPPAGKNFSIANAVVKVAVKPPLLALPSTNGP